MKAINLSTLGLCLLVCVISVLVTFSACWNVSNRIQLENTRLLNENLNTISLALNEYSLDHANRFPESLLVLIQDGYLAGMPVCPYTGQSTTEAGCVDDIGLGSVYYSVEQTEDSTQVSTLLLFGNVVSYTTSVNSSGH